MQSSSGINYYYHAVKNVWQSFWCGITGGDHAHCQKTSDKSGHYDLDGTSFDCDVGVVVASNKKSSLGKTIRVN